MRERELVRFGVGDREPVPIVNGNIHGSGRMPGLPAVGEYHLDGLSTHGLAQDRLPACVQVRLVDVELVGIHGTLHHGFPESVGCRDEHDLVEAGFGVQREHDARGAEVAAHHPLDAGRQRDVGVRVSLMDPIGNRPIVVETREYLSYSVKYII